MSFRKKACRIVALLAAFVLVSMTPAAVSNFTASAKSLDEMIKESEQLKKQAEQLKKKIEQQEKNLKNTQQYINTLSDQIKNCTAQIDLLMSRIEKMESNISQVQSEISVKENEIQNKRSELESKFQQLRLRLRTLSKTGNFTTLQMLLNTDSYSDYLIKYEIMKRIAENDKKLMDELEAELAEINSEKEKLEQKKADLQSQRDEVEKLKKESESKKKELENLSAKKKSEVQKLSSDIKSNENKYKSTYDEYLKLEEQIQRIINESQSSGNYAGYMFWPVPAVRNISSFYGPRWGRLHKGIDIANGSVPIYGQNIIAAASGTVIYANSTNSWGGGYGYHVIIDHGLDSKGRKISTLYAHCSKVFVKVGDKVIGGKTVIALAGNTGDVTGPHLHFEVRVNGVAVDPIANGYIKW